MSFSQAVRTVYGKYAVASGRASRSEYWWFQLFLFLAAIAWYALFFVALVISPRLGVLVGIAMVVFFLASMLPSLGVTIRRLHDSDKSGWWFLIAFIPYVGALILLVLLVLDSTSGVNRYGPPSNTPTRTVIYWGANQWEAWQRFVDDSHQAASAGFTPLTVDWQLDRGNQYLSVIYGYQPPQPSWNAPYWAPPPPPPAA
jgi:uncharacterized membrane protein YhaH (DUF805 family)